MRYDECPLGCTSEAQHEAHTPKMDLGQPPPDGAGDERAEFEARFRADYEAPDHFARLGDGYKYKAINLLWIGWQAARSRPASPDLSEDYARVRRELDAAHDELRRIRNGKDQT